MKFVFIVSISLLVAVTSLAQTLNLYELPENVGLSRDYEVYINDRKAPIYNTPSASFVNFSFEGALTVRVVFPGTITNYDIRPLSYKVASSVYRNEIHFQINRPQLLSVEINKNIKRPLFIFANELEKETPLRSDKKVLFYEAGKIHSIGTVRLKNDETVYIEGGAVIRGSFIVDKARNVRILGRGIIDNSHYKKGEARPIEINGSENVTLEGFIIAESKHWTCGSYGSKNVTYRNIKIVSDNDWDDGIDIVGSQNILVENCFIRTKDDCIAVKSGVGYFTSGNNNFIVDNIKVQNSIFWNGSWGNALEIGFETRTDTIKNVIFRNCDIIHVEGPEGTFTIHNGDRAVIKNVVYEDIRVEDARGYLIDIKILDAQYTKDKVKGHVDNVYFKNIRVEGDVFPTSLIMGFNEQHKVRNVTVENVFIHGKKMADTYSGMLALIHTEGITFK